MPSEAVEVSRRDRDYDRVGVDEIFAADALILRRLTRSEFLEDCVHVRAANPEGAQPRPSCCSQRRPRHALGHDEKGRPGKIDRGIGRLEVQCGRNLPALQSQRDLDATSQSGDAVEMTQVALDGSDPTELSALRELTVRGGQSLYLDRVTHLRGRSVGFDVPDRLCRDASRLEHSVDGLRLAPYPRRIESGLFRAVIVHSNTADERIDRIAVSDSIASALDQQHRDSLPGNHSVGGAIENPHVAVAREIQAGLVHVTEAPRWKDTRGADQGMPGLSEPQAL